jgi:hypothetical protein
MDPRPILAKRAMPGYGALPATPQALVELRWPVALMVRAHASAQRRLFDGRASGVTYRKSGRIRPESG